MRKTGHSIVAIVATAAVGEITGIVLAPDQRDKTLKRISKGFREDKDAASPKLEDLKNQVKNLVSAKSSNLSASIDTLIDNAENKSEEVISALEKKLAHLKADTKNAADQAKNKVEQVKSDLK